MDHQEALALQAVERYLLDELSSPQKESFEQHFFECAPCASALEEHEALAANLKAVLREIPQPQPSVWEWIQGHLRWQVLAPSMAGILIVLAGIPYLNRGEIVEHHLNTQVRASAVDIDHFQVPSKAKSVRFDIDLKPGRDSSVNRWAHLEWRLTDDDGRVLESGQSEASKSQEQFELPPIPVRKLSPGQHRLTVHPSGGPADGSEDEVSTFVIDK
jgi:hypothetical protein